MINCYWRFRRWNKILGKTLGSKKSDHSLLKKNWLVSSLRQLILFSHIFVTLLETCITLWTILVLLHVSVHNPTCYFPGVFTGISYFKMGNILHGLQFDESQSHGDMKLIWIHCGSLSLDNITRRQSSQEMFCFIALKKVIQETRVLF